MSRMEEDRARNYNGHATFLSEIALAVLNKNDAVLDVRGIREIIAMYLLIPYITDDLLDLPAENCNIPKLNIMDSFIEFKNIDDTTRTITLGGLRNAICHSFVTVEDTSGGEVNQQGRVIAGIIVDDRASFPNRKQHQDLPKKSNCETLPIDFTHDQLVKFHNEVLKIQSDFIDSIETEGKDEQIG